MPAFTDEQSPAEPSFSTWYEHLCVLAERRAWDIGAPEDAEMWMDYFEDGDSPEQALEDDIAHA